METWLAIHATIDSKSSARALAGAGCFRKNASIVADGTGMTTPLTIYRFEGRMNNETESKPWRCAFPAPSRCWYQTENGGWASRDWLPGEKVAYETDVLGHGRRQTVAA